MASHARASMKAGLDPRVSTHLLLATSVFAARGGDVRDAWSPGFPASRAT
jgi:hypothetical protein